MMLLHASLLLVWLWLATLISATKPAHIHEARQNPTPTTSLLLDPDSNAVRTSSPMSPTPSSSSSGTPSDTPQPSSSTSSPVGTPTSSSGTSSDTPQSSPLTDSFGFTVQNMTTCTPGVILWTYSGKEASLLLSITNIGVTDGLSRRAKRDSVDAAIQQQLVDTNTSAHYWIWSSVNVTQGWYEIQGYVLSTPALRSNSTPFFISNGTDVSCLTGTSLPASSTALPSATVPASAVPASAASKLNVVGIVGGIVGGVAGFVLVLAVALCVWLRRRKAAYVGRGGRKDGAWGSLKSTSSSIHPAGNGPQPTNNRFHAHSESTGAILQDAAGVAGKASATTTSTPSDSDEDVMVVSEEKLVSPASSSGTSPFDVLNTPVHYDRRVSVCSIQTPTTVASDLFRSRVPSLRSSSQSLEQQAHRIRSSMDTSGRRRTERLSMPTIPSPGFSRIPPSPAHAQSKEEYPLTLLTPAPVNRSISAGAISMSARRTSRKPVPYYDPSILEDKNADSASTLTAGAESSQSHGTGTGAHGTASDLMLKGGFGDGRPVHYLIPDLPPPQRE